MKRRRLLLLPLALALGLTGCFGGPKEAEEDAARQKGEQMMEEWIDRAYPGGELLSVEPYVFHNLGVAPYELTDLVSGSIRGGGKEYAYWLDTSSGQVYFEQSDETMARLGELCGAYVAEALELGDDYTLSSADVYIDLGIRADQRPNLLPAELTLSGRSLEDFLRAPAERTALTAALSYRVPEKVDLSSITLAETRRALEGRGVRLDNSLVRDSSERVDLLQSGAAYRREGFCDLPDFRVWMPTYERRETVDKKTGEITAETLRRDASNLGVERTAEGWKASFPNGWFETRVYAYGGSDMPDRTYLRRWTDRSDALHWEENSLGWALWDDQEAFFLSEQYELVEKK